MRNDDLTIKVKSCGTTEDYRTDKQLDQAEETAFLASQRAKPMYSCSYFTIDSCCFIFDLFTDHPTKKLNLQAVVLGEEQNVNASQKIYMTHWYSLTSIRMRFRV